MAELFEGLEAIERESMADKAMDRLILAIAARQLPPGARAIEGEIAERLGVSRIPVREAIQRLAAHGVLEPAGARGFRVAPFDDEHLRQVYELRVALETLMLRQAMLRLRAEPDLFAPLDREIAAMTEAARHRDALAINRADLAFHRHALGVSGHRLGLKAWDGISRHVQIIFGMEVYRLPDFDAIRDQHLALRAVLAAGDPAALEAELKDHILGHRSLYGAAEGTSRPAT